MTKQDLIYAAATIDCEGSIAICKHLSCHGKGGISWYRLVVAVSMTTKIVPEWLSKTFGGRLRFYKYDKNPNATGFYMWYLNGKAPDFIMLIMPYLKLKKRQAELALDFQKSKQSRQGQVTSVCERNKQEEIRNQMCELNRRGIK